MSKVNQELRVGEKLTFEVKRPGIIEIVLEEKSGQRARLSIDSDEDAVRIRYFGSNSAAALAKAGISLK